MSSRVAHGDTLKPAATANVTIIAPVRTRFELVGGVMNLFDVEYAEPGFRTSTTRVHRTQRPGASSRVALENLVEVIASPA